MKIVVGLSGGVDSSVAAYLLQQQGHEVVGLFMRNWNDASVTLEDECPWIEDSNDALMVAQKLGIPFQVIDMSDLYKERIVDYMFNEYEKGRTPNPDVLCNREVKFDVFLETALSSGQIRWLRDIMPDWIPLPRRMARKSISCSQVKILIKTKAIFFAS
ncbi:hypothetical protein BPO_1226 [Bergeyella porcorum]|uniref:tRNA-specific 2-thiouridylase MnmA n=1 Tax=Bergeyella porcorum TaxID=1735111 RepID=A0AAU0F511_9FLAO